MIPSEDKYHATRTASKEAAFFLSHLAPDMTLLDCGCGPGTITMGLAEHLAGGTVVGIDLDESALELARSRAREEGIDNVRFETGSVYELSFPNNSFDAVFSHALLEHLRDPVAALQEMRRVLKPEGAVGIRIPDMDAGLYSPDDPMIRHCLELAMEWIQHNGGDMQRGKHLRRLLHQAEFNRVEASASFQCFNSPETVGAHAKRFTSFLGHSDHTWIKLGLADRRQLDEMAAAWRRWADDPHAFGATAWAEAVGWKA